MVRRALQTMKDAWTNLLRSNAVLTLAHSQSLVNPRARNPSAPCLYPLSNGSPVLHAGAKPRVLTIQSAVAPRLWASTPDGRFLPLRRARNPSLAGCGHEHRPPAAGLLRRAR